MYNELNYNFIPYPSIVFAKLGEAIYLERKRILNKPSLIDNNLMSFKPHPNFDIEYIYYLFLNLRLSKFAQQTAVPSLSSNDIGDLKCYVTTSKKRQHEIATFFLNIDNNINFIFEEIRLLKDFKEYLLQNLFV